VAAPGRGHQLWETAFRPRLRRWP